MKGDFYTGFASALAMVWAGAAHAQADAPASTAQSIQDDDFSGIVVQAQRREHRLVDVPISVSTASLADLERAGAESIENLTKVTPGVYLQRASYGLSPTIRGIGSTLSTSSGEQNVGLYVDEIYYPTPTGNIFDLASVAGVEVLKGPQGTLFGRNATGGAILIRTLDPGFEPEGRFKASYERFEQVRSSAYVNIPVTDKIAVNGSVAYRYSDGYVADLLTGSTTNQSESFAARGKILVEPMDNLSVVFTAAYSELDDPTGVDTRNLTPAPILPLLAGPTISTDRFVSSFATDQSIKTNF